MVRFMRLNKRQDETWSMAVACVVAAILSVWMMMLAVNIDAGDGLTLGAGKQVIEYELITHVVQPGETLWGIAQRYRPGEDPRRVVAEIQEASGIEGGLIRAYQLVLVPVVKGEG